MVTKTFICDVCNKSVGEKELHEITISISSPKNSYSKLATHKKDVCVECLVKKGLMTVTPETEKKAESREIYQKTFETKFIELLEDLGVAFQE